ncbi:MAG: radical SAM protein [Bacillota bacterium]
MTKQFDLQQYLSDGVEELVSSILRAALGNPRESAFVAKFALYAKRASALRTKAEHRGEHIPSFLIASITDRCNLKCAGCYARANHACSGEGADDALSAHEWAGIFDQARALGISFILLAGGEPLLRADVLREAAKLPEILFPVFTNGTLLDDGIYEILDKNRNLLPFLSLEGDRSSTDARRGQDVYDTLLKKMDSLKKRGILYGASITLTKANIAEVTGDAFLDALRARGCKAVIFVEYVSADHASSEIAPTEAERAYLEGRLAELRSRENEMIYLSFPGDEKESGGCLAAGRGFFHINARGGAEPCPFSPYSDTSLRERSLKEALSCPLFLSLRTGGLLTKEHAGGCVLFENEETVKRLSDPYPAGSSAARGEAGTLKL